MIIYIDLLIILNFIYDYIILKVVSILLKRRYNKLNIILSCLFGEISILFLIFKFNYILLIISKLILCILINIICFKYKDIKYTLNNILYFYMISIIIAGFIYYLYINKYNYILIMSLLPIFILIFIKIYNFKYKYNNYYEVEIYLNNNHIIKGLGYLDTGNNIINNISLNPIIIVSNKIYKYKINKSTLVPIKVINNTVLIKCIKIKYIKINNKIIKNVDLGISDDIKIDNVDILLNNRIKGEIYD